MIAAAALSQRNVPIKLMLTTLVKNSPDIRPLRPSTRAAPMMPAQFTSRLRPPMALFAASIAALTSASEATSHLTKCAFWPSCCAAAWPGSSCTSSRTTFAPFAMRYCATPWPKPEAPPVITASAFSIFMILPLHSKHAVAFALRRRSVDGEVQREPEHAARVQRIDNAIVPQTGRRVIRVSLAFVLRTNLRHKRLLVGLRPILAADLRAVAPNGGQHLRGLLAAHD